MQRILNKSISQLLKQEWVDSPPTPDDSFIKRNLFRLYHKKLNELDIEDLRFLINQEILLEILIPIALEQLQLNVLAEGDFYKGDLLNAVLSVTNAFWNNNIPMKEILKKILLDNKEFIETSRCPRKVIRNIENFLSMCDNINNK